MDALTMYNLLTAAGMTAAGASGALGNWERESDLKGCNLQNSGNKRLGMTDEEYTTAVDNHTYTNFVHDSIGYGIVQWTYWSRKQALYNKAITCGCSIGDEVMQISFALEELKRDYRSVWLVLTTTASVREASDIMLYMYECPADQGEAERAEREKLSQKYYEMFNKPEGGSNVKEVKVIIGSARNNESGGINNGKPGDQTGGEVSTQEWYLHKKEWYVIRPKRAEAAEIIARTMEELCSNNNVGYCQDHRLTGFNAAKEVNFDIKKIAKPVEIDCSEGIRICVCAAGIQVDDFYTGNEAEILEDTDEFEVIDDPKVCGSSDLLMRGDILVTRTKGHTVAVLSDGAKVHREGWIQAADGIRWWYQYADGSYPSNGWAWLREATGGTEGWYLFDDAGYMLTGAQIAPDGRMYYLCETPGIHEGQCMVTDDQGALRIAEWDGSRCII